MQKKLNVFLSFHVLLDFLCVFVCEILHSHCFLAVFQVLGWAGVDDNGMRSFLKRSLTSQNTLFDLRGRIPDQEAELIMSALQPQNITQSFETAVFHYLKKVRTGILIFRHTLWVSLFQ